jgi:hypothetical protein
MVMATTAVVSAGECVPFVIPARPNSESLIAVTSAKPINANSDRLVADGHFYRGSERIGLKPGEVLLLRGR